MPKACLTILLILLSAVSMAQPRHRRPMREFQTDTAMVHDPVMAYENGKYYLFSTGFGIQQMTSPDRKTWTFVPRPTIEIPAWTHDSVPEFREHVWAPDIIRWNGKWWLTYSCSSFGKNTSAIGLMVSDSLGTAAQWKDMGPVVCSKRHRNNWNAIDSNIIIDENDTPWMTWGSFWGGIQLARLDSTLHLAEPREQKTIAARFSQQMQEKPGNNAIEAPFIFYHDGYYYLFASFDYCCRGMESTYRVAVGRSRKVDGPYLDNVGRDMADGGGTVILEGDKKEYEAVGHSAAYHFPDGDLFICHGYAIGRGGQSILIQRRINWTADGWPVIENR